MAHSGGHGGQAALSRWKDGSHTGAFPHRSRKRKRKETKFDRSRERPIPHALIPLPSDQIQEDLRYDVEVEMELVRPPRGAEETGQLSESLLTTGQAEADFQATLCSCWTSVRSAIQRLLSFARHNP